MKSKISLLLLLPFVILSMSSFMQNKKGKDLLSIDRCNVSFTITTASGCQVVVTGTINCSDAGTINAMNSFQGTIYFGGLNGCPGGTVTVSYAVQTGVNGGWQVPTGYAIAFYFVGSPTACSATGVTFIGSPDAKVNLLNSISSAFLDQCKKISGC